jgi:hypothetical protein
MKGSGRLAATLLVLAALACNTFSNFTNTPGPGNNATAAAGAPTPTVGGSSTATPSVGSQPTAPPSDRASPTGPATEAPPRATPAGLPFTLDQAAEAQAAMLPQFAADVSSLPDATRYVFDVAVTFDGARSATLTGHELIRYTNRETMSLDSLYLMLWPNFRDQYLGGLTLGTVSVAGSVVQPVLEDQDLAARIPLSTPLKPGARLDLQADFTTRADAGAEKGARFGLTHGVLLAPTFYPLIPRIVNGKWQTDRPAAGGDTTNSDTAFYAWRVTAPADMAIAASGKVMGAAGTRAQAGDSQTQTLLTGPMRDVALVVGHLQLAQRTLPDGIVLNAWVLPEHTLLSKDLLDEGAGQVQNLENLVGPYPFAELDIVDTPGTYGGVEYPGLVFIGVVNSRGGFEPATVHEVGHQWFYSLIGDDQLVQPWLDEAAASYTEVLYAEHVHGADAAARYLAFFQDEVNHARDPNLPIGLPIGGYPTEGDYGAIVYAKGALFFAALRQKLGDQIFFTFLHDYYTRYKYGFADSAGFEATAESTCKCDLKPMFKQWVFGN